MIATANPFNAYGPTARSAATRGWERLLAACGALLPGMQEQKEEAREARRCKASKSAMRTGRGPVVFHVAHVCIDNGRPPTAANIFELCSVMPHRARATEEVLRWALSLPEAPDNRTIRKRWPQYQTVVWRDRIAEIRAAATERGVSFEVAEA